MRVIQGRCVLIGKKKTVRRRVVMRPLHKMDMTLMMPWYPIVTTLIKIGSWIMGVFGI